MTNTQTQTAAEHWDRMYATATRSAWTQNAIVEREVYIRMTGQPGFWLEWLFASHLPPIKSLLSIGCGDGGHEIAIARRGFARHVTAFDASPVAIGLASEVARSENLAIDFSVRLFEEFISTPLEAGVFDAVLFSGSLHHVTDIEGMLAKVRHVVRPGGRVIVNEYVGPCYQLYPDSQVRIVNQILEGIPPEFRAAPNERLILPSIDAIMANDPTEGVRSALIPILLPMYFRTEYHRLTGGGLLHPLFSYLNGTKINDGSVESRAMVSALIAAENALTSSGALAHDFLFGVYIRD